MLYFIQKYHQYKARRIFAQDDVELPGTGLKVTSKVIVSRIVTLDRTLITRSLGNLGVNQLQQLNILLIQTFQL